MEIKAPLGDLDRARAAVARLGARAAGTMEQVDRYYELADGRRLKLRTVPGRAAELISYRRPETSGVRVSEYEVTPVRDGDACIVPRSRPLVIVRKCRELHLIDNVRVHLDAVDGLGSYLELEAVIDPAHDEATCRRQVADITRALGIADESLIRASYAELLLEAGTCRR